ncbi:MAG: tRNA threonylcarbamoyladenosine dehydratase [Magnetococcales bacterium]|nr:tRNA threonylcarbamoyladenosine dehydratase [Magnetococcales bacterium]NGZ28156.1 tRNA threonylcarbamoyladenosine dehydratase [Magnetococcales bacterium]
MAETHVLLCGLGGVGSFTAEALVRAGIGRLSLVDHDVVAPSNLNRQLPATLKTIGQKKVVVMGERLASIHPECQLELHDQFLTTESIPDFLAEKNPHWVVDAIDSLNCKVNLILEARKQGMQVISSMGAGGRLDPTKIRVSDLLDTHSCPLASHVRSRVKRRGGGRGILAVWSEEHALPHKPPEPTEIGRPRAVNGTISYMPALFGLTIAGVVIESIVRGKNMN